MRARYMEPIMSAANTTTSSVLDLSPSGTAPPMHPLGAYIKWMTAALFPVELSVDLWLLYNMPVRKQQLTDLRYALYYRCSRAEFKVSRMQSEQFQITGPHSTLLVPNNASRREVLRKLRMLVRDRSIIFSDGTMADRMGQASA